MHIAAVQLDTQWEDRPATHARILRLLDHTDLARDTLVVLPEMFDVGFSANLSVTDPGEPSVSEHFLRQLARDRHVAVLAGVVARDTGSGLANEALAYAPDGTELVRYRKMRPFTPADEHINYPAGDGFQTFNWQGVQIAPFVCYDLRFPELFRPAARAGAELFIVVANWPTKRSEHWVRLLQARAIENQAYALGVNRCGTDPHFVYDGRSCLFDNMGTTIYEMDAREQVIVSEIDATQVRTWRADFPALRDMQA